MPGKIFINYRREDTRADAARIRDRLVAAFGAANVFMDVDNLMAGQRFDQELAKALGDTDIFLAVMGARWPHILYERSQAGGRDYVREEIAQALARGVVVIPVTIERAPLPPEDWLPPDLKALALHQKHDISHDRFGRDVEDLVQAIKAARGVRSGGGASTGRAMKWASGIAAALVLAGVAAAYSYETLFPPFAGSGTVVRASPQPAKVAPDRANAGLAAEVANELRDAAAAKQRADEVERQRALDARQRGEMDTRLAEERDPTLMQNAEAARMKAIIAEKERQMASQQSAMVAPQPSPREVAAVAKEADEVPPPNGVRRVQTVPVGRDGQFTTGQPAPGIATAGLDKTVTAPVRKSPVTSGYVAVLGLQKSQTEAMKMMAELQSRYESLRDKRLEIVQSDQTHRGLGLIYRIVIGPRQGITQIREICEKLYQEGMPRQGCFSLGE